MGLKGFPTSTGIPTITTVRPDVDDILRTGRFQWEGRVRGVGADEDVGASIVFLSRTPAEVGGR